MRVTNIIAGMAVVVASPSLAVAKPEMVTVTKVVTSATSSSSSPPSTDSAVPATASGKPGTSTGTTSYTDAKIFQQDILAAHNFYRKQHNASNLIWNETSAKFAAKYVKACNFEHSGGPTGENLVSGPANVTASIDLWGQERSLFNFKSGGFSHEAGHFTQLVWKNTTSVGCGVKKCDSKTAPGFYTVCEYFPGGNIVGEDNEFFRENVQAQVEGKPEDTAVKAFAVASGTATESPEASSTKSDAPVRRGFSSIVLGVAVAGLMAMLL